VERLARSLASWCRDNHVERVSDLIGGLKLQ
jgi:hypothetical protein